jgi:hypothetical protein
MNPNPTNPDPPFGSETDEAISAALDGELGAFAAEHGITEEAVRDRLESWPGFAARRAALDHVRGAVHAPTPPLDDVSRRRLVRTASNEQPGSSAATPRPTRSWARLVAVAAAGLIVVAGIAFAVSAIDGDDASMTSGDSAGTSAAPLHGDVGDLGDVTRPEALRALLDRREAAALDEADAAERSGDGAEAPPSATSGASSSLDGGGSDSARTVTPEACAAQLAGERKVAFTGTGTYQGTPVTIIGITERGRTIVFVVPSTDCTNVLASISR